MHTLFVVSAVVGILATSIVRGIIFVSLLAHCSSTGPESPIGTTSVPDAPSSRLEWD